MIYDHVMTPTLYMIKFLAAPCSLLSASCLQFKRECTFLLMLNLVRNKSVLCMFCLTNAVMRLSCAFKENILLDIFGCRLLLYFVV